ncbi:class I SAM-dependent methyltransferase [Brachybacterium sp. Z12]|uniref:class I SAM-dependent methyltransferase n=1 Tax=Brachybacterium sp. Z12 TaxID=2759167 RepID=UPI00292A50D1|nr:class I SAM-dependent methyltransferase [Brachybacterium sp. Z12]
MPAPLTPPDPQRPPARLNPPVPPVSSRDEPRFRDPERKSALAAAFQDQGEVYDRLRPGYPDGALAAMLAQTPPAAGSGGVRAIDLGAGTGKLSWALVGCGLEVTAVDTSAAMLETARDAGPTGEGADS